MNGGSRRFAHIFTEWVDCPMCGSANVDTRASPDREIGFECLDCGEIENSALGDIVEIEIDGQPVTDAGTSAESGRVGSE